MHRLLLPVVFCACVAAGFSVIRLTIVALRDWQLSVVAACFIIAWLSVSVYTLRAVFDVLRHKRFRRRYVPSFTGTFRWPGLAATIFGVYGEHQDR